MQKTYLVTVPVITNEILEGTEEQISEKMVNTFKSMVEHLGVDKAFENAFALYQGEAYHEPREDDEYLISSDSIAMLKMMIDNGLIEFE